MELLTDLYINTILTLGGYSFPVEVNGFGMIVFITSVVVYYLYIKRIFERNIPPSIVTWGLWLLLDIVAVAASLSEGSFNVQLITYTLGTAAVCGVLAFRLHFMWHKVWDTIVVILAALSALLFLLIDDAVWSMVAAFAGMSIAAMPLVRDLLNIEKEPWTEPWDAWMFITIGSAVTFAEGFTRAGGLVLTDDKVLSGLWLGSLQFCILSIVLFWHYRRNTSVYNIK